MSVEQPSTKRSKKADAKANASGSTVSAAADVNDHKHLNASLTLLRTQDDLIALAGLPLDHDLVIDNFKLCAIIRGIVAASEAGSMFDETEVSMRICGRSPRAVRCRLKSTPCLFSLFFKPLVLENKTRKAKKQTTVLFEITHSTTPAIFFIVLTRCSAPIDLKLDVVRLD